jgi:hypothetical protein
VHHTVYSGAQSRASMETTMQRTIVMIYQRFVDNENRTLKMVQIGKIDCVDFDQAKAFMAAFNAMNMSTTVSAELAVPVYTNTKTFLVPIDALQLLILNLCHAGIIDRDSLPEAERTVADEAYQAKQEALAAERNAERNNEQRKPRLFTDNVDVLKASLHHS